MVMVLDFRLKHCDAYNLLNISGVPVKRENTFRYLGVSHDHKSYTKSAGDDQVSPAIFRAFCLGALETIYPWESQPG